MVKTVMAQGVFDILHPGHLYYFEESSKLGDELVVVLARDSRIDKKTYFDEKERLQMIQGLRVVDEALLGSEGDIYSTVQEINPDVITLGYDQNHSEKKVKDMAEKATGHNVNVTRIKEKPGYSSTKIREF